MADVSLFISQVSVVHYLVKWKDGGEEDEPTWEPYWNLEGCKMLVEAFEKKWQAQYNEPVAKAKPKPKPAPDDVVVQVAEESDDDIEETSPKKRKFMKRSIIWDAFVDVGKGMFQTRVPPPTLSIQEVPSAVCRHSTAFVGCSFHTPTIPQHTATLQKGGCPPLSRI